MESLNVEPVTTVTISAIRTGKMWNVRSQQRFPDMQKEHSYAQSETVKVVERSTAATWTCLSYHLTICHGTMTPKTTTNGHIQARIHSLPEIFR